MKDAWNETKVLGSVVTDLEPAYCFWYDPTIVSGPLIGVSPRWMVTVDEDGIAWTWCCD